MDTKLKCVFEMPDNAPQVSEIPHLMLADDTATHIAHEAWAVLLLLALIPRENHFLQQISKTFVNCKSVKRIEVVSLVLMK